LPGIKEGGSPINLLAGIIKWVRPTTPYFTGMGQKTGNIDIRVEPHL
jgi:hypothetical protein